MVSTVLILFYSLDLSITVNEEYWVYDTTGLIGAIGGSLGLFAGFSFFDCICLILNWIYSKTIEN